MKKQSARIAAVHNFLVFMFFFLLSTAQAQQLVRNGTANRISLVIENMTDDYELSPYIDFIGQGRKEFVKINKNRFENSIELAPNRWFNFVNVKLVWKKADLRLNGESFDFEQSIALRFTPLSAREFSIPAYFSTSKSEKEMSRLERQGSPSDYFRAYFRGDYIATYYREDNDQSGQNDSLIRRAVVIFYRGASNLSKNSGNVIAMSDEAANYAKEYLRNIPEYDKWTLDLRSLYWLDLQYLDRLVIVGNCKLAGLLLQDLREKKMQEPNEYKARFNDNEKYFSDKESIFRKKCELLNGRTREKHD